MKTPFNLTHNGQSVMQCRVCNVGNISLHADFKAKSGWKQSVLLHSSQCIGSVHLASFSMQLTAFSVSGKVQRLSLPSKTPFPLTDFFSLVSLIECYMKTASRNVQCMQINIIESGINVLLRLNFREGDEESWLLFVNLDIEPNFSRSSEFRLFKDDI